VSRLHDPTKNTDTTSDTELVERTREGDAAAFAELWRRHHRAGLAVARSFTGTFDPDDLVSEAFTKIFHTISRGGGPNAGFRPYLFTAIRNTAASWGRASREVPIDNAETIPDARFTEEAQLAALDQSLAAQAFRKLPDQWQEVLWYTEVEGMAPRDVAPLLGLTANAVAALAYRAREGLRASWVQVHLDALPADSECRWTVEHLGASFRKRLSRSLQRRVDAHLADCEKCSLLAEEAGEANKHIGLVLLPIAAGIGGAAAYTAWMATSGGAVAYAAEGGASLEGAGLHLDALAAHLPGVTAVKVSALAAVTLIAVAAAVGVTGALVAQETPAISVEPNTAVPDSPNPTRHVTVTPQNSPVPLAPSTPPKPPIAPPVVVAPEPVVTPRQRAGVPRVPGAPTPSPSPTPLPGEGSPTPTAPVILSPVAGPVESDLLVVHGTADAGVGILLQLIDSSGAVLARADVSADAAGAWSAPLSLVGMPDGVYSLKATATRGSSTSPTTTVAVTVCRTLSAPTVTLADSAGGRYFPILAGAAAPGATVHAIAGTVHSTTTADANGSWAFQVTDGLTAGRTMIDVQQSLGGRMSPPTSVKVDLYAPALVLANGINGLVVTVTGDPAATIQVRIDQGAWLACQLDGDGRFTMAIGSQGRSAGTTIETRYAAGPRFGLTVAQFATW
jgi:RNA polymerase sigma factor (sigma-70 family)